MALVLVVLFPIYVNIIMLAQFVECLPLYCKVAGLNLTRCVVLCFEQDTSSSLLSTERPDMTEKLLTGT